MGPFLLPVMAFVLWEFPSMIVMSVHKMICAVTGRSLAEDFLGVWAYRTIGMIFFWPVAVLSLGLAVTDGIPGVLGRILLTAEVLSVAVLLIWARASRRGA
jgi:hypothetical protein